MPRLTCLLHLSLATSSQATAFLRRPVAGGWKRFRVGRFSTTKDGHDDAENIPITTIQTDIDIDWNDRIGLQATWTNEKKGWKVDVEWRQTKNGRNLKEFQSLADIESYIQTVVKDETATATSDVVTTSRPICNEARLSYVADFLWGFDSVVDEQRGNAYERSTSNDKSAGTGSPPRFFGMWVPGSKLSFSGGWIMKQTRRLLSIRC
jgi:hypothetical protein